MSKIIIQIDDSDVAIKRLSSILDMKICTPLYRRRVHDFTKCSGTFEIRITEVSQVQALLGEFCWHSTIGSAHHL